MQPKPTRMDDLWEFGAEGDRDALLATIEDIARLGTWIWDVQRDRVAWSPGLYRILGYDPATTEANTENFFRAVHPEDVLRLRQISREGAKLGQTPTVHFRVMHTDGQVRHCQMDGLVVHGEKNEILRFVGTVIDTTETHQRERELARTAKLLNEAQRIARVGSWYFEVESDRIEWTEELYSILGLPLETRPSHQAFFDRIHPDDLPRLLRAREVAFEGKLDPLELRVVTPKGQERSVILETRLVSDAHGSRTFLGIVLDITERKQLEEDLLQAQKLEAIGRLAGGIAHDFNNLLAIIQGSAELLRARTPTTLLDDILQATSRGSALTRQLLAFSRRAVVHPVVLDLNQQVQTATRLMRRLIGEDVRVELKLADALWTIEADPTQLELMVMNLALNARDAMPSGGVLTLRTENLPREVGSAWGDQVVLTVADTGIGMSAETRSHIFEPFFTTKPAGQGTGLGLPIVYGIVTQSRGRVTVDTEPGRGTTFRLYFPRATGQVEGREANEKKRVLSGRERLLLVEDDDHVRTVMELILKGARYEVTSAEDPARALAIASNIDKPFDLLITDVVMPGLSGRALAKRLWEEGRVSSVMYVTGYAPENDDEDLPGAAYLQKPFSQDQLLALVRSALERSLQR